MHRGGATFTFIHLAGRTRFLDRGGEVVVVVGEVRPQLQDKPACIPPNRVLSGTIGKAALQSYESLCSIKSQPAAS